MAKAAPWIFLALLVAALAFLLQSYWHEKSAPAVSTPEVAESPSGVPAGAWRAYERSARAHSLPSALLLAIGEAESDHGRSPLPGVRSGINAADCCAGPMQLCVRDSCGNVASVWARDGDGDGEFSVYDVDDSVATAAAYLAWMRETLGPSPRLLAAGYNAGPTIVREQGVPSYPETLAYVEKVLQRMEELR